MIITLVKANFSANNIGTLDSFAVLTNLGSGLTYNGPSTVVKNGALNATITLNSNYVLENISIVMGNSTLSNAYTIDGNTISINIAAVTGVIVIVASTVGDISTPEITTTWHINTLNQLAASGKDLTTGTDMTNADKYVPWAFSDNINSKVVGKKINAIEIVPHKSGQFSVGKYNLTTQAYETKAILEITEDQVKSRALFQFDAFSIGEGEYFTFNTDTDEGMTCYFLQKDVDSSVECCDKMLYNCQAGVTPSDFNYQLAVAMNVGYIGLDDGSGEIEDTPITPEPDLPTEPEETSTTWYINTLNQLEESGNDYSKKTKLASNANYAWAFDETLNNKLVGQTINTIELYPNTTGIFHIGKFDASTNTVTESREFTVDVTNQNATYTFDDMTINEGEFFVWNNTSNTSAEALGYYILEANVDPLAVECSTWYQAKSSGLSLFAATNGSGYRLCFMANIGYTPAE